MFAGVMIRKKILYSTVLLTITLLLLLYCSLRGVYAYRSLTIDLERLSTDIQRTWDLRESVAALRDSLSTPTADSWEVDGGLKVEKLGRGDFASLLSSTRSKFETHRKHIAQRTVELAPALAPTGDELDTIDEMIETLHTIERDRLSLQVDPARKLARLSNDLGLLSSFMTTRMNAFRSEMRSRYRSWIIVIMFSAAASLVNIAISFWYFRRSVVQPFKELLEGCRSIAAGRFEKRIHLNSQDELSELAEAMNGMTDRFLEIRNNLNQQVQERTREVVRSEQLASVGFLAAGVAHEINNPLASIAWSAEALESRLHEVLHSPEFGDQAAVQPPNNAFDAEQVEILREYLKRIQEEAFRCKGITERLLDFSRLGESQQKQETDIDEAVSNVCELVRHLGQYRNRKLKYVGTPGLYAWVSPTEFKQVVLNLLTNALDATEDGGQVDVRLEAGRDHFQLRVIDQGCGMTEEVIRHLFEPFFTRRREGRGTGLGLSITYRIVQDHGGSLVPSSPGPNQGSTMELTMPINHLESSSNENLKAAA
jgi:signal transduction histidine kinase